MIIELWNPEHPHHAVWREYTQSLLDGKPKVVEYARPEREGWQKASRPAFDLSFEYRIARPTLTLTYTVPMPVTEPLKKSQEYWVIGIDSRIYSSRWNNDSEDMNRLKKGLIYLNHEDAQAAITAHAAAMRAALEAAK